MPHTACKMASASEVEMHDLIFEDSGVDTRSMEFRTVVDQEAALLTDVVRIRSNPLLPADLIVGGAIYDVHTGVLSPVRA